MLCLELDRQLVANFLVPVALHLVIQQWSSTPTLFQLPAAYRNKAGVRRTYLISKRKTRAGFAVAVTWFPYS